MSAAPRFHPKQRFEEGSKGRPYPVHTPGITRQCRCRSCQQKRAWTPERRRAFSTYLQADWASGTRTRRRKGVHPRAWTPPEDRILAELAGKAPISDIATELVERGHIERSEMAIRVRAGQIGLSLWVDCYSLRNLEAIFGVPHTTIKRHWAAAGRLKGRRWRARGRNPGWWFDRSDIEQFIATHAYLIDVERMQPRHPFRRLAEVAWRADPWIIGRAPLAQLFGVSQRSIGIWATSGKLPHRRRPGNVICVRGRDIPAIRAAIHQARVAAHEINWERFRRLFRQPKEASA